MITNFMIFTLAQHWPNVVKTTLAQCWPNIGPMLVYYIGPTLVPWTKLRWANEICQCWPNVTLNIGPTLGHCGYARWEVHIIKRRSVILPIK